MPVVKPTGPRDGNMSPPTLPEPPKLKPMVRRPASQGRAGQTEMPKLTRAVHWQQHQDDDAYTSVHVSKEHKDVSFQLNSAHCFPFLVTLFKVQK